MMITTVKSKTLWTKFSAYISVTGGHIDLGSSGECMLYPRSNSCAVSLDEDMMNSYGDICIKGVLVHRVFGFTVIS